MIKNKDSKSKYIYAFVIALVIHAAIFALLPSELKNVDFLSNLSELTKNLKEPIKLDEIDFIKPAEVEKFRKVGIKNGLKDLQRPDLIQRPSTPPSPKVEKPGTGGSLSFEKLATTDLPKPIEAPKAQNSIAQTLLKNSVSKSDDSSHFYFNYKDQKVIPRSNEQEILKNEASKNFSIPSNKATDRISNFEIRYERPEGVSEDELNSDEKAYYSFYVRSYKNYFAKIYSNYEKIVVERPGLAKVFDRKHLLIGKIDYDENGNIITVKILKSSESDDLHYFFEETLKQLNQPNPPKVFTRNNKQFSIYYQIQIN